MLDKKKGIVMAIVGWLLLTINLMAQSAYDIRLNLSHYDTLEKVAHYDVQLRSSGTTWGLAGQNYRLYYDAAKAIFLEGMSKLPSAYQRFNLVQHVNGVDATSIDGGLAFANHLGFINFAIDLSDTYNGGIFLPNTGEWITTASLSFKIECELPENCMQTVWARADKTNAYATSFVEISTWESPNVTKFTIGNNYFDLVPSLINTTIDIRVFLSGAYDEATGLMRDDLRQKGYLPLEEPYSSINKEEGEFAFKVTDNVNVKVQPSVFEDRGNQSIVDWILVEIRNAIDPTIIEMTKVGLLQREGRVVEVDGLSELSFEGLPEQFYVAIKHRNHLGIMCQELIVNNNEMIDFINPAFEVYGKHARLKLRDKMLLWTGNADSNQFLSFQGGGSVSPDVSSIFWEVLSDTTNHNRLINHIKLGYNNADTNMDGFVKYAGPENDVFPIFLSIVQYPENYLSLPNYLIREKLPE